MAGGLASAADIDPTLVRVLFVVAALSVWGIAAYLVLALVLQDETVERPARPLDRDQRRNLRIGLGLAAVASAVRLFDGWLSSDDIGLPLVLITLGALVLWARRDQGEVVAGAGSPPPGGTGPGWLEPSAPEVAPSAWSTVPAAPLGTGGDRRSTGHDLLRLAAAFVAVGAVVALVAGGFLVAVGAVSMRLPFLPAAVGAAGVTTLVVGVIRRAGLAGLLVPGGVLVVTVALAVGLASFPGGAGNRIVVIGPGTPLLGHYEHSGGRLVLDLRDLTVEKGTERQVVAEVGTGRLVVMVPPSLATDVTAHVGVGSTTLFGRSQSGPGVDVTGSHAGAADGGHLLLELDVGLGEISVELAPEPTVEVACVVPDSAKGDGTDLVTCRHVGKLQGQAMSCSVALVDLDDARRAGRAFCRRLGSEPPSVGLFATSCTVPGDSDVASCVPLPEGRLAQLQALRAAHQPGGPSPAAGPTPLHPPSVPAPAAGGVPLSCGDPDAAGVRTCTAAPAATTTTAPSLYRCTEDPATRQLSCVPA